MQKFVLLFISIFFLILIFLPFSVSAAIPIKILLVPGHNDDVWGAQYGNLKEAEMNLVLTTKIYNTLKKDKRFEAHTTRNSAGYTKEFTDYFTDHKEEIITFKDNAKKVMQDKIADGSFVSKQEVPHITASEQTTIELYGINKWANENKMDLVLHVHFNDYPRATKWAVGKYKGFAVYMPEAQMVNSKESEKVATSIFKKIKSKYMTSTYPEEKGGLIPEQKLIAIGSNDTLTPSVRAVLVEYGYIYRFGNSAFRQKFYTSAANLTSLGIKKYFFP